MSKVDDYGLFDARPIMLRTSLYPLRVDRVREADIARWIAACETAGVIALYVHGGKPYGQMLATGWQKRSEPKQPLPPWGDGLPPPPTENGCEQVKTVGAVFGDGVGVVKPPHPPAGGALGFADFWKTWPVHPRKVAREQCEKKWQSKGCQAIAERVISALKATKKSEAWTKDAGDFIPAPLTWLNQARWEANAEVTEEWYETAGGIKTKGAELGIPYTGDDACKVFGAYRARVFMAAGHRDKEVA